MFPQKVSGTDLAGTRHPRLGELDEGGNGRHTVNDVAPWVNQPHVRRWQRGGHIQAASAISS